MPTKPNSRQGDIFLINLASDVPPDVDSLGLIFVFFLIIFWILLTKLFGSHKNASPDTLYSISYLDFFFPHIFEKIVFNFFFKDFDVCLLLNRILKVAPAEPGIILSMLLSIFILVTSRLVGWKFFVPLSNFISFNFFKISTIVVDGLLARCGYATCPWTPLITNFPVKLPLLPILTISPNLLGLVGSPTKQKFIFSFFFFK